MFNETSFLKRKKTKKNERFFQLFERREKFPSPPTPPSLYHTNLNIRWFLHRSKRVCWKIKINYIVVSALARTNNIFPEVNLKSISFTLSHSPGFHSSVLTFLLFIRHEIITLINRLWGFSIISISPFDILEETGVGNPREGERSGRKSCSLESAVVLYHTLAVNTGRIVHPSSAFILLNSEHILTTFFFYFFRFTLKAQP